MVTFREGLISGLRQSLCSWLDDTDANVRGWTEKTFGRSASNPVLSGLKGLVCSSPPLPPVSTPPFVGGQCPGVVYRITGRRMAERRRCSDDSIVAVIDADFERTLPGPISGPTRADEYGSCDGTRLQRVVWTWTGVFANGDPALATVAVGNVSSEYVAAESITFSVSRVDGQPDDCGDPPPVSNPPSTVDGGWPLPPVNIIYDNSTGGTTEINVAPVIFAPVVNVDGSILAPVSIVAPNININANVRLGGPGGIDIDFGERQPPGSDTTVDAPPPPQPPQLEVPPPDDDDTERRIIGVVATVTDIDGNPASEIGQPGGGPTAYVPDLGLVSFAISAGSEGFGWTSVERVKNTRAYIACPAPQGAINVKGAPRPGVTWELTPVYGGRSAAFTEPR